MGKYWIEELFLEQIRREKERKRRELPTTKELKEEQEQWERPTIHTDIKRVFE